MQPWVENLNDFLQDEGREIHVFACGDRNMSFIKGNTTFNISKRLIGFSDQFSPVALVQALIDRRPSIAVIHGFQHLLTLFSMIVYFVRRVPVVVIVHGLYASESRLLLVRDLFLKLLLYVFKSSYLMIALTRYDRELLLMKWCARPERVKIAKGFLYVSKAELERMREVDDRQHDLIVEMRKKPVFLYIGRLDHDQKRVDQIVRTFHEFLNLKAPDAELVIAGTGPLKGVLSRIIASLRIQRSVKLVGSVTEDEKWLYLLGSRALLLMSRFEGMPRVIFEAFAAGRIVIVPDTCGIGEVVRPGINGFLFERDEEVVELLATAAANGQQTLAMQEKTRLLTRTAFSPEKGRDELRLIIESQASAR